MSSVGAVAVPIGMNAAGSQARRVVAQTLAGQGARLGLVWIITLAIAAVFAPFLANTRPLLVSIGGRLASPTLQYLEPADAILLGITAVFVLTCLLRLAWPRRLGITFVSAVVLVPICQFFVQPPTITVYETYRQPEWVSKVDWSISAPVPYSPKDYLRDYSDPALKGPSDVGSGRHWFGTESNGADVLSRMIHASRIALGIGFVATGIAIAIGIVLGGLMGYFSGAVDMIGMRLVEIFEAVPTLFLLLTFVAFFGRSLYLMMVIIGITGWTGYARYVRAEFLKLRQQDFVQAAVACGLPLRSVLFRHMLPNAMGPVLVSTSFGIASAILIESILSFLGLGLVDDPSWGQMLNQAVQSANFYWWMAVFPGGAIFLTVLAYNLIGEALRDAIDPHLRIQR